SPINISSLTSLTLNVQDVVNPTSGQLATSSAILFPAIDPTTAANTSNFQLLNMTTGVDESVFITSSTFVADAPLTVPSSTDPTGFVIERYLGHINLTFAPGLPSGDYQFIAHTNELQYPGLADAAGNFLDETFPPAIPGQNTKDFILSFTIGNTPV